MIYNLFRWHIVSSGDTFKIRKFNLFLGWVFYDGKDQTPVFEKRPRQYRDIESAKESLKHIKVKVIL